MNGDFSELNADRRHGFSGRAAISAASRLPISARRVWVGTLAFWVVVFCLVTARILFLDVSKMASSAAFPAGSTTEQAQTAKLSPLR
jgi:hypothetical protein